MQATEVDHFPTLIKIKPEKALEQLYTEYYDKMCKQVYLIIKDSIVAEDIVQEVFMEVWKKKDEIVILSSTEAYLRRACRNRTLNYIRDHQVKWEEESRLADKADPAFTTEDYLDAEDLNKKIQDVIMSDLPEKCGIVFSLSRYEDMSYAEISKELNISTKTVEHQISKALRILREKLFK